MSMNRCDNCGLVYDEDFYVEHPEECAEELQNEILEESTSMEEKLEKLNELK